MPVAVLKDSKRLELEDIPVLKQGPEEVLVKIVSCGFCATDDKAIKGIRRNVSFPLIPGYEPAEIVAEIGKNVTHFKIDDEVICQPSGYCGRAGGESQPGPRNVRPLRHVRGQYGELVAVS